MSPERQKPSDPYGHLIAPIEAALLRQRPKDPLIPEIFAIQNRKQLMGFIDSLHNRSLDGLYSYAQVAKIFGDRIFFEEPMMVGFSYLTGEKIRKEVKKKWVPIRNKICQSKVLEKLKKGEYDQYGATLTILTGVIQIWTGQPVGTTLTISSSVLKIATRNVDRFCTKAGLNFDEMEKAAKKLETEHNH